MLRIAYIVHTFHAGGLERCVARLASHLDRTKFQPLIICLDRSGSATAWLESDDIPVFELHRKPGNDFGVILRLARLLREENVDIIHSHNWGSLLEAMLARRLGSISFHVHAERGLELAELQTTACRRHARRLISQWAYTSADALVAVSQEIHQRLMTSGANAQRVHLIPNGIDPLPVADADQERSRIRSELGLRRSSVIIACAGRLVPVKDFATAITAVSLLVQKHWIFIY